jgi:hypothetical protein
MTEMKRGTKRSGKVTPPPKQSVNVLVVGDWIIDEDWIVTDERSVTASKLPEEKHYAVSFGDVNVTTKKLCGASLTASAIRGCLKRLPRSGDFNVYGIGAWHPADDDYMEVLFKTNELPGANPFSIRRLEEAKTKRRDKRLFNIAAEGDSCASTRVVRIIRGHPGTNPNPVARCDWHLPWRPKETLSGKGSKALSEVIKRRMPEIFSAMGGVKFDAIVLADFNKGLISGDFVMTLARSIRKSGGSLTWFYRTKQIDPPEWYPGFLRLIGEDDIFVRFIDPMLAKPYAKGRSLMYGSELTSEGLEFLEGFIPEGHPNAKLAVLFQDNSCIAYDSTRGGGRRKVEKPDLKRVWVINSDVMRGSITRGRSSIFLASLVLMDLARRRGCLDRIPDDDFGKDCEIGITNGVQWCDDCLSIWKGSKETSRVSKDSKKTSSVSADITTALFPGERKTSIGIRTSEPRTWKRIEDEWESATDKEKACCISESGGKRRLEVWRAHTTLNEFTVLDKDRKESVVRLTNAIRSFVESEPDSRRRPVMSLIRATAGSGKSFLAKCLASEFGLDFLECNVGQLTRLNDLSNFFDQVDVAQRDGRQVLVFLDEADTLVQGESALGYLLELMWCGRYYRDGLKNTLGAFPGIVAMSGEDNQQFKERHPKYADFRSRVFGIELELKDITEVESLYLFAKLLTKYFGEIAHIHEGVLKTVCNSKFGYGPRSVELLVSLLEGVKRDCIEVGNLPNEDRISGLSEHFPEGLSQRFRGLRDRVELVYNQPT